MDPQETGNWIIGAQKHLQEFGVHRDLRHYRSTLLAGKCGRLLNALRGVERITNLEKLEGIAADIGILPDDLYSTVLPRLEKSTEGHIVTIKDKASGEIIGVEEYPVTKGQILEYTTTIWESHNPKPIERIGIESLNISSQLPRELDEFKQILTVEGFNEEDIALSVELQDSFGIVKRIRLSGSGDEIVFADYIWRENAHKIIHALREMDYPERDQMLKLVDNIVSNQGYPLRFIKGISHDLLALARRIGLIDVVRISTTTNREEIFSFTPAMVGSLRKNELEKDLYDDIKALVSSLRFATLFASGSRLDEPIRFLEKLIDTGEAGHAPAIGRDYVLAERRNIVKVVRVTGRYGTTYGLRLIKKDVAESTLEIFEYQKTLSLEGATEGEGIIDPRTFVSPEGDRIRLERAPTAREALGSELADRIFLQTLRGEI